MSTLQEQQTQLLQPVDRDAQARRLNQISSVLSVVLVIIGVQTVLANSWTNSLLVILAMLAVMIGRRLNQRGATDAAIILVLGVTRPWSAPRCGSARVCIAVPCWVIR